jgi:23S rRNA pseudouridine2457 synthase
MHRYFIVYKPYLVHSRFSSAGWTGHGEPPKTLHDFFSVPLDVYPVGRLDHDSEGLLLLSNDAALNHRLLDPAFQHEREYWVQVEGDITQQAIDHLQEGVSIRVDTKLYHTCPCQAGIFAQPPALPERNPPIRERKSIAAPWIHITLTEGKNRQVRRMTAAVGHPTLRLVRYRIGGINLGNMLPGDIKELSRNSIYQKLFHEKHP